MKNKIILVVVACLSLSGCSLYKNLHKEYEPSAGVVTSGEGVFGSTQDVLVAQGDSSMAVMSWREFFTDPLLQQLIERVLEKNTDLNSARIAVEKGEAALYAAKKAYLPSVYFTPSGSISSFDFGKVNAIYDVSLQVNWDLDAFGSLFNKKHAAQARLLQSQAYVDAVHANLISTVAQQYYMLQLLDRELEILIATDSLWNASLEIDKVLWENGKIYSTAVNQLESSYLSVKTQIIDARRNIRSVENAICQLLAESPHHIERSSWGSSALLEKPSSSDGQIVFDNKFIRLGVPATMIELRPDIRIANLAMAEAFYNTQDARSAFYPSLSLQGAIGWTNNAGGAIVNPGKILLNALASLTQPIFARGKIKAQHKIAQLTEQDLQQRYVQTVIDAGNQVNEALSDCQAAREKHAYYHRQIEVLKEAYMGTHELMDNGKANYLEVLTAQESLLNAQLSEATNMFNGAQALIELYIALGGATK